MKPARPRWNSTAHKLFLGKVLLKHFRTPARNQELILTAFQEQNWPSEIENPLPYKTGMNPKKRLHDTIKQLNRHQTKPQFGGIRQGHGISWSLRPARARAKAKR